MVEAAKSIVMANAPKCGPSRFARKLFFDSHLFFQNPINLMYALSYRVNFIWNAILMNSIKKWNVLSFFQAIGFLELIRAEMIIQAVWAWWSGRLRCVNITILPRPVATAGCFEHSKLITPPSACRVNTFIFWDSSKPFSLIHDWNVWLFSVYDWLLAETDDCFDILTVECCTSCTTGSKETFLHSLLLGFGFFGWLNSKKFLFRLTAKILLSFWMATFIFLLWHYLLYIPTQENKFIKSGKGLTCWKPLTPWKRLGLLKAPDSVTFKTLIIT